MGRRRDFPTAMEFIQGKMLVGRILTLIPFLAVSSSARFMISIDPEAIVTSPEIGLWNSGVKKLNSTALSNAFSADRGEDRQQFVIFQIIQFILHALKKESLTAFDEGCSQSPC